VDAAADVHAFLISIRDNDRQAFNAYVDKSALSRELEARLDEIGGQRGQGGRAVAAALAHPLARAAADAAVRPDVFRFIAITLGYSPDRPIPNRMLIARALRPLGDGRVCAAAARDKPCLMTFTHEGDVWRLTAVDMGSVKF
jgi:hypothetical protein